MRGGLKFGLLLVGFVGLPVTLYLLSPKSADHLALAKEAIARRDFAHAQRELDTFLKDAPQHAEALLFAAQTARRAGDYETADKQLRAFRAVGGSREEAELEEALRDSQQGFVGNAHQVLQFCRNNP